MKPTYQEILADPDSFVTAVFSSLASEFLVLPKGEGFIEYPQFEAGYEALKKVTANFSKLPRPEIINLVTLHPNLPHRHPLDSRLHAARMGIRREPA